MGIRVGEEVEEKVFNFPVELDEPERSALLGIAKDKITEEELEELLLEWLMVKIIKDGVEAAASLEDV